jgi:hypothetical protein
VTGSGICRSDADISRLLSVVVLEAAMVEPWDSVGTTEIAGTHKAQEGASRWLRCSHWW